MAILYRVVAAVGKYEGNDGKEKSRYVEMGVVMETKNGPMLKLESIPAAGWDGWAYLNEPKPKEEGERQERSRPNRSHKAEADDSSDIPF